jgi:predicted transcriptional regulator
VVDIMRRDFIIVDSYDMLETAFSRLQECDCPILPVTRNGSLVGLVTSENVGEFLMIQTALGPARRAAA